MGQAAAPSPKATPQGPVRCFAAVAPPSSEPGSAIAVAIFDSLANESHVPHCSGRMRQARGQDGRGAGVSEGGWHSMAGQGKATQGKTGQGRQLRCIMLIINISISIILMMMMMSIRDHYHHHPPGPVGPAGRPGPSAIGRLRCGCVESGWMGRFLGGGKNPYGVGNAGPGWPLSLVARKTVSYQGSSLARWWERDCLPGASLRGRYEGNDDGRFSLVSFPTSISRDATPSLLAAGGGAISIHSSIIISKMGFVPSLCVRVCADGLVCRSASSVRLCAVRRNSGRPMPIWQSSELGRAAGHGNTSYASLTDGVSGPNSIRVLGLVALSSARCLASWGHAAASWPPLWPSLPLPPSSPTLCTARSGLGCHAICHVVTARGAISISILIRPPLLKSRARAGTGFRPVWKRSSPGRGNGKSGQSGLWVGFKCRPGGGMGGVPLLPGVCLSLPPSPSLSPAAVHLRFVTCWSSHSRSGATIECRKVADAGLGLLPGAGKPGAAWGLLQPGAWAQAWLGHSDRQAGSQNTCHMPPHRVPNTLGIGAGDGPFREGVFYFQPIAFLNHPLPFLPPDRSTPSPGFRCPRTRGARRIDIDGGGTLLCTETQVPGWVGSRLCLRLSGGGERWGGGFEAVLRGACWRSAFSSSSTT